MTFWLLALVAVTGVVVGLYFGYEFTMRRAEEWIEDHVATDHHDHEATDAREG